MSTHESLTNATIIVAVMVLATLIEFAVPLVVHKPVQCGRTGTNLRLTVLTLAFNGALTAAAAALAITFSVERPSLLARLGVPQAAEIVASIAVLDFFYGYVAHRTMHASPVLWRVHRVHHSDLFVDVTTTYRTHPLEVLWRFLFMILPVWVLGVPAAAVAIYRILSAINAVFEHANVRPWRGLDRAGSLIWVTPNTHKVHHSNNSRETDSNYGNILSVFDRLFGTFTSTARAFSVVYGLNDPDAVRAASLARLLSMPFHVVDSATRESAGTAESVA